MKGKLLFPNIRTPRFNVAAWQDTGSDNIFMVTREVQKPGSTGEPDIGKLVLVEFDHKGDVIHEKIIWEPLGDSLWLEDPRALALDDGSVVIGLTALLRGKSGYLPYPAITRLTTRMWRDILPAITLIEAFGPGKNLTPIDAHTFMFRPNQTDYSHKLLVFSFTDLVARKIHDIEFPTDLPWAQWRIGTTMPPLWLTADTALMIFHGISLVNGIYIYNLGRARLQRINGEFKLTASPEPILTPDDFLDEHGKPIISELHPEMRRVVYVCGGVVKHDQPDMLTLYVNVGDAATFEVDLALSDLRKGLL